jgi:CDP-diacylglycerol--glycerol-3-phosphate 3-phosphatidyltransferase
VTAIDLHASVLLVALLVSLAASYAVRVALEGPARFDRVKEAGASPLLGASAMEMGYWGLQPLARACVAAGVSADRVTHASLALGAAAGVAVAGGHLGVGAALATAAAVGDAVDGLVARSTATATRRGAILDAAADRYAEAFFLAGLALHYHADQAKLGMVLAALVVGGGVANVSAVRRLVAIAHAAGDAPPTRDAHAPPSTSSPPAAGLPSDPALDDAFARLAPR